MIGTRPLRIFTWHVHGSYLYYLCHAPHQFYVPVKPGRPAGYAGRPEGFPWPPNLHEIPVEEVPGQDFDVILFQSRQNYLVDQHEILSPAQQALPRIYLEHDPPRQHPTDTHHPVDDSGVLLVHVTHFNALMWDSRSTPTAVIEHGVTVPDDVIYTGELGRGVVVINHLCQRGRRLGADIFEQVRHQVPLDLLGMGWQEAGGLGELPLPDLPAFTARYRFFFSPIRYTSLGLAICEAMMIGLPVIGLATTELATVIRNGVSGYLETDPARLVAHMQRLLGSHAEAAALGREARRTALERFNIGRFVADWNNALLQVTI